MRHQKIVQRSLKNENTASAAQVASISQGSENAENNAADISALIPIQRVLHSIVVITRMQFVAVVADGYEDFVEFDGM